ncbi:hypothetical protein [Streptomyces sp. NPDC004270]
MAAIWAGIDAGKTHHHCVAELLRGRPVGQVVVGQVRSDAGNVGAVTESPQQLLSKAAGHGTPFRLDGPAARATET